MRILHTSDWHVGRAIRGRSRAEEHRAVLGEIARVAGERDVDLVLVTGDLFDSVAPSAESEQILYAALLALADVAPVVIVGGNHDNPRRLEAVAPLLALGRVRVVPALARPSEGGVVEGLGVPVRVAAVPWVSQRGIVTAADLMSVDADVHAQTYSERLRAVIGALCESFTPDTVNVVAGHLMVLGAEGSGSERGLHTVVDYAVPALALPGHISYGALGHLHRRQRVPHPAPVWYAGSPLQLDFGEAGEDKGVLVVDAEPGRPSRVEEVALTSGVPLVRLRGTLDEVAVAAEGIGEAYVRVEIEEPSRVGLADEVRDLVPGVVDIVVVPQEAAPGGSVAPRLGREPRALFAEYLAGRGVDDPRLLALFDELAEEIHET